MAWRFEAPVSESLAGEPERECFVDSRLLGARLAAVEHVVYGGPRESCLLGGLRRADLLQDFENERPGASAAPVVVAVIGRIGDLAGLAFFELVALLPDQLGLIRSAVHGTA
jgi:hypothetical protein